MVVWDGGAADLGHLNGARWSARFTIRIIFVQYLGRYPLYGVDNFWWWHVSWMCRGNFQSTAVEYRDLIFWISQ